MSKDLVAIAKVTPNFEPIPGRLAEGWGEISTFSPSRTVKSRGKVAKTDQSHHIFEYNEI